MSRTPGPWNLISYPEGVFDIEDADGVTKVVEGIANSEDAALIVAAPELLEGLKKAGGELNFALPQGTPAMVEQRVTQALKTIRDAIAKARGGAT